MLSWERLETDLFSLLGLGLLVLQAVDSGFKYLFKFIKYLKPSANTFSWSFFCFVSNITMSIGLISEPVKGESSSFINTNHYKPPVTGSRAVYRSTPSLDKLNINKWTPVQHQLNCGVSRRTRTRAEGRWPTGEIRQENGVVRRWGLR